MEPCSRCAISSVNGACLLFFISLKSSLSVTHTFVSVFIIPFVLVFSFQSAMLRLTVIFPAVFDTLSPSTRPSNPPSHHPSNPLSLLPINLDQQAVYRDGRNPTFWCSIGVLYFQINQFRDALDAYSCAIRINHWWSAACCIRSSGCAPNRICQHCGSSPRTHRSSSSAAIDVHSSPNLSASVKWPA
jgi:hypothetical protein